MKLSVYKALLKSLEGLPSAQRKKAMASLDGQPITDDAGNPVSVEVIELSSSAPAAPTPATDTPSPDPMTASVGDMMDDDKDKNPFAKGDAGDPGLDDDTCKPKALTALEVKNIVKAALADAGSIGKRPGLVSPAKKFVIPAGIRRVTPKNFRIDKVGEYDRAERAYRFGMWCLATTGHAKALSFCQEQGLIVQKLHVGNVNTAGGFLVPEEFGTDLIDLREEYGVFRKYAKVEKMTSDTKLIPRRSSGLTAYFTAEGAAGTESTKSWDQVRLVAKDLMVLSRYTNQLNEDAVISIGDDLAGEISYAFANKEDDCGFNGDGTSTYGGIVGVRTALSTVYTDTGAGGVGMKIAAGNAYSEITLADFNAVVGLLPQYADKNPKWYAHKTVWGSVMQKLATAGGGNTVENVVNGAPKKMFLGYEVVISQVLPKTEANSQVAVLFGDLALASSFGDREQDAIQFSEHASVGGQSVFERNELAVRGTERFDINVHDVGDTTNAGPIVGLRLAAS